MSLMSDRQIFDAIRERKGVPLTQADVDAINAVMYSGLPAPSGKPLAWGARVSATFRDKVRAIAASLGCDASDLMTCIAWESGRTFAPHVLNAAGSGATGLIQFMPATAKALGTTVEALAKLTAEQQLDWVEKYFRPYRNKLATLADLYMAILWPRAVGAPMEHVLWDAKTRPTTFRQNAGLDGNKDGAITKAECAAKLYAMKAEGLKPENMA